ncbi:DNA primase [Moraxella sp. ZJ142]|uniref:DNA primase n=1 Tax=Moraxella marmotae TaxID=3344520 RepID=UPI0035D4A551
MRIPESVLEALNSQADLVAMIGKHTTLKPAGREFKGCCPFHGEKTPSFYVNPETNLYYCFGCHAKGNPITFLKEYERLSFVEAVKYLSEQTGVELPKDDAYQQKFKYKKTNKPTKPNQTVVKPAPTERPSSQPQATNPPVGSNGSNVVSDNPSHQPNHLNQPVYHGQMPMPAMANSDHVMPPVQIEPMPLHEPLNEPQGDLYSLLDSVYHYYRFMLENTPIAKQYFINRGLTDATIATFGLGYAPEGWQHLEEVFPQDIEGLKILGLVRDSSKTQGRTFDLLRNRIIFPIRDNQGRVVGFAGRSLGDELPKYINSSESPVFQKQHILYGLYEARQQKASNYLMVEGYMDVIALHQAGICGAVAPMGTAANEKQIDRLLRYHNKLTLCFDGDEAGQRAAWRTLEIATPVLHDGRELYFLTLPDNHDPDTYLKTYGTNAMQDAIDNAMSISDYLYGVLSAKYDLSRPEQKAHAMATLRQLTDLFPKGSSLKWWLNSDIYQKLKTADKAGYARPAVSHIDYTNNNDIQVLTEIALHLIHTPSLLTPDPLAYIIEQSGMDKAHLPFATHLERQSLGVPDLPSWASFDSGLLGEIIDIIRSLPTDLLADGLANDASNASHRHDWAYFIIAAMSDTAKREIQTHWQAFAQNMLAHQAQIGQIDDRQLRFFELLCTALKDVLQKQQAGSKNLILSEIYKHRLQFLTAWDNTNNKAKLAEILTK